MYRLKKNYVDQLKKKTIKKHSLEHINEYKKQTYIEQTL